MLCEMHNITGKTEASKSLTYKLTSTLCSHELIKAYVMSNNPLGLAQKRE